MPRFNYCLFKSDSKAFHKPFDTVHWSLSSFMAAETLLVTVSVLTNGWTLAYSSGRFILSFCHILSLSLLITLWLRCSKWLDLLCGRSISFRWRMESLGLQAVALSDGSTAYIQQAIKGKRAALCWCSTLHQALFHYSFLLFGYDA